MAKRRLIGPTAICLLMSGLLADHLYFNDSPWSVLAFLSKMVSIIVRIFGPALNAKLYEWLDHLVIPATMVGLAVALLWLTVARAKRAMSQATPDAAEAAPVSSHFVPIAEPSEAAHPSRSSPATYPRKCRLTWKLTIAFATLAITFTAVVGLFAYARVASVFEKETKRRANFSAITLSEIAKHSGGGARGTTELQRAIENHASNSAFAYIYVEDADGRMLAHMPPDLPRFLRLDLRGTAGDGTGSQTEYRGLPVLEVMEGGKSSGGRYVHLAVWQSIITEEVRRTLLPIVASIVVLVCAASAVFARAVRHFTSSFSELVHYANRVSHGELDLDLPIKEESDEVRDLACSFARLRSSLHAVLTRLKDAPLTNHSNEIR